MKRRWKLLGAVCVFVVGVTFLRIPWKAEQKSRVERQFHADLEELTQTAELVLAGQEAEAPSGWRDVSRRVGIWFVYPVLGCKLCDRQSFGRISGNVYGGSGPRWRRLALGRESRR